MNPQSRLNAQHLEQMLSVTDRDLTSSEDELRDLAEDIIRYCPSLTQLLLALGSEKGSNPLDGMN